MSLLLQRSDPKISGAARSTPLPEPTVVGAGCIRSAELRPTQGGHSGRTGSAKYQRSIIPKVMKVLFSFFLVLVSMLPAFGQQAQEDLRTDRQLVFPTFRKAKVLQTFGRSITAEANVLYRDGALCFIDPADGKVRKVANASVLGAVFDDSIRYEKVDGAMMGRVVATQGYNKLLCVTTIDMDRYRELTTGSTDLPFVSLDSGGALPDLFMDLSGTEQRANKGYPLKRTYYFSLRGKIVPAKERLVKKEVREDMKLAFKNLMDDRWWSWGDEKSLQRLLMFFPE